MFKAFFFFLKLIGYPKIASEDASAEHPNKKEMRTARQFLQSFSTLLFSFLFPCSEHFQFLFNSQYIHRLIYNIVPKKVVSYKSPADVIV